MESEELIKNIDKIHTTWMGIERIKKNMKLKTDDEVIPYCKKLILDKKCVINLNGKNYYCILDNTIITINAKSYTIITAHRI